MHANDVNCIADSVYKKCTNSTLAVQQNNNKADTATGKQIS